MHTAMKKLNLSCRIFPGRWKIYITEVCSRCLDFPGGNISPKKSSPGQ